MVFETIAFTDYAIRARGDDSLSACLAYGFAGAWRVADAADGGASRSAVLTGLAAALGASLAMIGRNTAVALGAAFVYLNVVEGVLRAWKPWLGRCFISEKPPSS